MVSLLGNIIATLAICASWAYLLGKAVPSIPNKLLRFCFFFVLGVPVNLAMNYVNVRTLGYHKMGWNGILIIALLFAAWGTFWPPQPRGSGTP